MTPKEIAAVPPRVVLQEHAFVHLQYKVRALELISSQSSGALSGISVQPPLQLLSAPFKTHNALQALLSLQSLAALVHPPRLTPPTMNMMMARQIEKATRPPHMGLPKRQGSPRPRPMSV